MNAQASIAHHSDGNQGESGLDVPHDVACVTAQNLARKFIGSSRPIVIVQRRLAPG